MKKGSFEIKVGLAEMLKGGVIMDVTNSKQAKIFPFLRKNFKHKIDQNDQKKPFQSSKDAKIVSNFFKSIICDYLKVDQKITKFSWMSTFFL